jgi:murein DD-endopeptidase MepM/ murein hydrolase activator NlpD
VIRILLTIVTLGAASVAAASPRADVVTIQTFARAWQPGEVMRLEVTAPPDADAVRITVFDRELIAARRAPGVWDALAGIDLEMAPAEYPVSAEAVRPDGTSVTGTASVVIVGKEFPTRTLRVNPRFVAPPARVQPRIAREAERLGAVFASVSPLDRWYDAFTMPIDGAVVSGFGVRSVFNGEPRAPHGGADLASRTGTPVKSPGGGTVVLAGNLYFTGNTVVVDHGAGLFSLFAHLSRISVSEGAVVRKGTRLGRVGATGRVTGPHLHWSVRLYGARVDPVSLVYALAEETSPSDTASR